MEGFIKRQRRYSGVQGKGLKVLLLLSYIFNISLIFINNTIKTRGHLDFNLVNRWDRLECQEEVGSRLLTKW
jgi:hypothetical protein